MKNTLLCLLFVIPLMITAMGAKKALTQGAKDNVAQQDYWIAPNPSTDFLNLYSGAALQEGATVRVFNIVGTELKTLYPDGSAGDAVLKEDVSSWLSGTYLVRIESNGKVLKTMRFVRR